MNHHITGLQVPFNRRRSQVGPSSQDRTIALLRHKAATAEAMVTELKDENERLRAMLGEGLL